MSDHPPIKRHEVFLIIALLFLCASNTINGEWRKLVFALGGLGYMGASVWSIFKDKSP